MTAEAADATDLSGFEPGSFDAVFCLGPMYHLRERADQRKCISECLRVLKPGGILAVAYINKFFMFPYLVKGDSRFLTSRWMAKFLEEGRISSADEDCFWTYAYFHTPEEIEQLLGDHGADKLEHAATDGIGVIMRDTVNGFSEEQFDSSISSKNMLRAVHSWHQQSRSVCGTEIAANFRAIVEKDRSFVNADEACLCVFIRIFPATSEADLVRGEDGGPANRADRL